MSKIKKRFIQLGAFFSCVFAPMVAHAIAITTAVLIVAGVVAGTTIVVKWLREIKELFQRLLKHLEA